MTRLLDTNLLVNYLRDVVPVVRRVEQADPDNLVLCSVVKAELRHGALRSERHVENLEKLRPIFERFESLPFDDVAAEHYAEIRVDLERKGTPIGNNDLMIASIARSRKLIVVTHNVGEFSRVQGLRLEDWQEL